MPKKYVEIEKQYRDQLREEYRRDPAKCLREAQHLLEDALRFHKGPLNDRQVKAIEDVKTLIARGNLTLDEVISIDESLYRVGLDTIP